MIESYYLRENPSKIVNSWVLKKVLAQEILKKKPLRSMQPDLLEGRSKIDLMYFQNKLGVRGNSLSTTDFEFHEIKNPDSITPELNKFIGEFLSDPPPMTMSQIRFRCGDNKETGLWIDASHQAIQDLELEAEWLKRTLNKSWIIEFGQKAQEFILDEKKNILRQAAKAHPWLNSYNSQNQEVPLISLIANFSQPGPEANRALIATILDLLDMENVRVTSWAEYGAGYGNLSVALASHFPTAKAWISENDPYSFPLLEQNMKRYFPEASTVKASAQKWDLTDRDLLLIDPPRSGFPELLTSLKASESPPHWVLAIHCHLKGLAGDTAILQESGYRLKDWSCVDLFPATPYMEHISLWEYSH